MNELEKIEELKEYSNFDYLSLQHKLFDLNHKGGFLYLIRLGDTDIYKIGISINPDKRLKQLQLKSPIPLELVCTCFCHDYESNEKYYHEVFKEKRIKGEWFKLSLNDLIIIIKNMDDEPLYIEYNKN